MTGKWRGQWRLSSRGLETAAEIEHLGIGGNTGDLAAGQKRRQWRLSNWLVETLRLGIRDNSGELCYMILDTQQD